MKLYTLLATADKKQNKGPRIDELPLKEMRERLMAVYRQAETEAGALADPEKMAAAIWNNIPSGQMDLIHFVRAITHFPYKGTDPIYQLASAAYNKLACRLTRENKWNTTDDAWRIGQEIQQLWPLWKKRLTYEFRWSFEQRISPEQIAANVTLIRDNILEEFKLKMVHVLSRHESKSKVPGERKKMTEWHVQGVIWPLEGAACRKKDFELRLQELKSELHVQKKSGGKVRATSKLRYDLIEVHFTPVKDLPSYAQYLGWNLRQGNNYRKKIKEEAQGANLPFPPDAAHNVRLYGAPKTAWTTETNRINEGEHQRRAVIGGTPWQSHRNTKKTNSYAVAYRQATSIVARRCGITAERIPWGFTEFDRREIFRIAGEIVKDSPRVATVRGRDGYIYKVIGGNAVSWETIFFFLKRRLTAEDYRLLKQPRPEVDEEIMIPVSLHQLHRLGQAEVAVYAQPPNFRPVCPITGRLPKPMCQIGNWVAHMLRDVKKDDKAEKKWLRRVERRQAA